MPNMRLMNPEDPTERIGTSRRATRGLRAVAALITGAALVAGLSACGGGAAATGAGAPDNGVAVTSRPSTSIALDQIPTAEPFGTAQWGFDLDSSSRIVIRPDRVVVLGPKTITARDENGDQVWQHDLPEDVITDSVHVHTKTVSFVQKPTAERMSYDVTQLSLVDGSVVATNSVTDTTGYNTSSNAIRFDREDGSIMYITQDGSQHTTPVIPRFSNNPEFYMLEGPNGDIPSWVTDRTMDPDFVAVVGTWTSKDVGFDKKYDSVHVAMVSDAQNMVLIGNSVEAGAGLDFMQKANYATPTMVHASTGEKLYSVKCDIAGFDSTYGPATAVDSPNGEFSVIGNLFFTASEAQCVDDVNLKAVDDNGTAYGAGPTATTLDGEEHDTIAVRTVDGDVTVSNLPEGVSLPEGFMNNGLSINVYSDPAGGGRVVTANPVTSN